MDRPELFFIKEWEENFSTQGLSFNLEANRVGIMGILDLRYGYTALIGRNTVRDDVNSAYNRKKFQPLMDFKNTFYGNYDRLTPFMDYKHTGGASDAENEFTITHDSRHSVRHNLSSISRNCNRFSIVIKNLDDDIRNLDIGNYVNDPDIIQRFVTKSEEFMLQIFEIDNRKYPLNSFVLMRKPDDIPHIIMANSFNVRERLVAWFNVHRAAMRA